MANVLLTIPAACFVSAATFAKTKVSPPAEVEETFKSTYRNTSEVAWKSTKSEHIAEIKASGKKTAADFSKAGKSVCSKTDLSASELPAAVKSASSAMFKGMTIKESKLKAEADGTKQHLVESKSTKAVYTENGKFLK